MRGSLLLAALAACTPTVAGAQVTQLLFDELLNTEYVADFYDGGFGSLGTGPGPAYGVTFGSNAQVLRAGNYQGNPSPPGAMFWESGTATYMNVAGGFDGAFSLFYSAVNSTRGGGSVTIWSGTNGTGSALATLDLPVFPSGVGTAGCPDPTKQFCPWVAAGTTFTGTAMSVSFAGPTGYIGFDNVTFGSADPTSPTLTPEPATVLLVGTSLLLLAGVGAARRRRGGAAD